MIKSRFRLLLALPLAFALAACGDDGDGNPSGPSGDPIDQDTAEQAALAMVESLNELVAVADQLLLTGPGAIGGVGRSEGGAVYDPETMTWIYSYAFSEGGISYSAVYTFQYLNGGVPVESYESATGYTMTVDYDSSTTTSSDGGTTMVTWTYDSTLTVDEVAIGRGEPVYAITGNGTSGGTISGNQGGTVFNYVYAMSWDQNLTKPAGGCPTGTTNVSIQDWNVESTYNGTSTYSYVMKRGETVVKTGNGPAYCGL